MAQLQVDSGSANKTIVNLLPCRIHHTGSVGESDGYWAVSQEKDEQRVAYFRGRKLHGKTLKVPEGYKGLIVEAQQSESNEVVAADHSMDLEPPEDEDADAGNAQVPVGKLATQVEFDGMIIWGHEATADASGDAYVRGVEEWIDFAEKMHAYEGDGQAKASTQEVNGMGS